MNCPFCHLPIFHGPAGYAGPQCRCQTNQRLAAPVRVTVVDEAILVDIKDNGAQRVLKLTSQTTGGTVELTKDGCLGLARYILSEHYDALFKDQFPRR